MVDEWKTENVKLANLAFLKRQICKSGTKYEGVSFLLIYAVRIKITAFFSAPGSSIAILPITSPVRIADPLGAIRIVFLRITTHVTHHILLIVSTLRMPNWWLF